MESCVSDSYGTIIVPIELFANRRIQLSLASGFYYLTMFNDVPATVALPLGTEVLLGQLFQSPSAPCPALFNNVKNSSDAIFQGTGVQIETDGYYSHNVVIQAKLEKKISTEPALNYVNRRELRCFISSSAAPTAAVDTTLYASVQPDASEHETLIMNGTSVHNVGDVLSIAFQVVQDADRQGQSDSLLTVFRISWNLIYVGTEPN